MPAHSERFTDQLTAPGILLRGVARVDLDDFPTGPLCLIGKCAPAFVCKLTAGHLGKLAPKDFTAPLTWFTSCVRQLTKASREWIMAYQEPGSLRRSDLWLLFATITHGLILLSKLGH
jgi:hypothetical protein